VANLNAAENSIASRLTLETIQTSQKFIAACQLVVLLQLHVNLQ
jgi:hypothetical protein